MNNLNFFTLTLYIAIIASKVYEADLFMNWTFKGIQLISCVGVLIETYNIIKSNKK